ncbi:MAG: hypothetical protein R3195_01485 [Gemmatimonadota bacterium]|nr:hypothetical protein [Gemmatimonadota bacterium]
MSEIFALATGAGGASVPALREPEGLTLAELQDVAREVGLPPDRVARAAAVVDARSERLPRRTMLGSPVTVGRVVDLPRDMTDREWQILVADLRQTFDAKGEVSSEGGVREWSNGNLHAVLERTESGHRLRMGTRKGNAPEIAMTGAVGIGMSIFMSIAMISAGKVGIELILPAFFAIAGTLALLANVLGLPRWADERERQMDSIAVRVRELLAATSGQPAPQLPADAST